MARVLAVDDDPVILRLLQLNLELEGHEVATAVDGRQALEQVAAWGPEVVLLDVMMPHVDGFQVCQQLRDDPATRDIPVVFLSAKAQSSDVERGNEVGGTAYVTKPFDPLALVELIEQLAASRGIGSS